MSFTNKYKFNKPAQGSLSWGQSINNNFDSLDGILQNLQIQINSVNKTKLKFNWSETPYLVRKNSGTYYAKKILLPLLKLK